MWAWGLLWVAVAAQAGDVERGRALVADRQQSLCLLCHSLSGSASEGNLAPPLAGAGSRWTAEQLRERLADSRRLNPASIMPPYASTQGLQQVAPAWQGRALFTARQMDDVVAYLVSLK